MLLRPSPRCLRGCALAVARAGAGAAAVKLATSLGDIVVELDPDKAPKTVDNFLQYVKDGHYDGTVFHRVIDNFMIQGGGLTPSCRRRPRARRSRSRAATA